MLRASDADRDAVVSRLRTAASEGRLEMDELSERVDAALRARTYGELGRLVDDLPSAAVAPRGGAGRVVATARSALAVLLPVLVAVAVVAAVVAAVAIAAAWWAFWALVWFVMCGRRGCSMGRLGAGPPRRRAVPARW